MAKTKVAHIQKGPAKQPEDTESRHEALAVRLFQNHFPPASSSSDRQEEKESGCNQHSLNGNLHFQKVKTQLTN